MKSLFFIVFLFSYSLVFSQDYHVDLIPKELKSYAKAVIRQDRRTVIVNSSSDMIYKVKRAYTILNQSGDDFAKTAVVYSKIWKIKNLALNMYNAQGFLIGKVKMSEFKDNSYINDFSLFEDTRIKSFNPIIHQYPITIEVEFELKSNQTFNIPDWFPQYEDGVSVQQSSYEVIKDPSFEVKYKTFGIQEKPEINIKDKKEVLKWEIKNLMASRIEPYSLPKEERLISLRVSAVKFAYEGLKGEYTDWLTYGKWFYNNLLKGKSDLSSETQSFIKELVKEVNDQKEAAKLIYEYVQKKNRYISIQVGIGGFMPMKASEVDALSYGDCKALTNYTAALLKVAGINSHYTEVYAGTNKVNYLKDFASGGQGNHIILCIPFEKDTIWLECTSKDAPFGYLGSFTQDRNVLLIKETGGELVRTPRYDYHKNLQIRTSKFVLDHTGNLNGEINTRSTGLQSENREGFNLLTPKEKETEIKELYRFLPDFKILNYQLDGEKENLSLMLSNYASVHQPYYNFSINPVNVSRVAPKEVINRKNDLHINIGYIDIDSIYFKIPDGYLVDNLPKGIKKEFDFGSYEITSVLTEKEILTIRKLVLKEGKYPSTFYQDFVDWYGLANKFDHAKCILRKEN